MLKTRGVPHNQEGHQTVFDWKALFACPDCGNGELRSHSHDCWSHYEDEPWDQDYSFFISPDDIAALRTAMARCTKPLFPGCDCAVHTSLRDTDNQILGIYVVGGKVPESDRPQAHVTVDDAGIPAFVRKPA